MITVKQAKDMGVVFVKGDGVRNNADHKLSPCDLKGINESNSLDHYIVTSFTDRPHDIGEMPCDGGLPVVVDLYRGLPQTGRNADEFNWLIEGVSGDITSWKPDLEAMEAILKDKEVERGIKECIRLRNETKKAQSESDKIIESISIGMKPKTTTTYELVMFDHIWEVFKLQSDGIELFVKVDEGYDLIDNNPVTFALVASTCGVYRKVEKEIDWREEVKSFLLSPDVGGSFSVNKNCIFIKCGFPEDKLLEMCRVALRATGQLERWI